MRTVTAREANQNFSKLLAEVEAGETVVVTKRGKPAARLVKAYADKRDDPEWRAAHARFVEGMKAMHAKIEPGYRVGVITDEDKRARGR
jgi:prevent-host-death family protein